ncbi:C80 family cysteine peptidase [Candidatus Fukatsuia endosymbiont of Tuberolachnus salignus]|uniref:C80 family cysteine peptidase n=1 Tax=Candidatus Fukatsuia endosymbiont of Tuberolachnus salignus TaxID=3077957 RepID=UPI00313AD917
MQNSDQATGSNQPEASSDINLRAYYGGKTSAEVAGFKLSANYLKFQQEYEHAIQIIIDFYKQHALNQGQNPIRFEGGNGQTTVENMFSNFRMDLFAENVDPAHLHSLYKAKEHIEKIAQSLLEMTPVPTVTKLDEIRELAIKVKLCGPGVYSYIMDTKLRLTGYAGELSDNFSACKYVIARAVITEFTSGRTIPSQGDIHTFNGYWNHFGPTFGSDPIEDPFSANITISRENRQLCQNALQQALTPYSITAKLATDHLNNLRSFIGDATEWGQIPDILSGLKSSYKAIYSGSLIEELPDSPGRYRLRQDHLWLQVEIAKQLSFLPPEITWLNWGPSEVEGKRLQRIGNLFWQEVEGEVSQPTLADLVKYVDEVTYQQLIYGIEQITETDPRLGGIDPKYLQVSSMKDISLFFSKLGVRGSIDYTARHLDWFNGLSFNPLIDTILTTDLAGITLAEIPPALLVKMTPTELQQFFSKLGVQASIDYTARHLDWFNGLSFNPLIDTILTTDLAGITLAEIPPALLVKMTPTELQQFFSKLGVQASIDYTARHLDWFNRLSFNPLIDIILTTDLAGVALAEIPPALLVKMTPTELQQFFSKLGVQASIDYITGHLDWFNRLKPKDILFHKLSLYPDGELANNINTDMLHSMVLTDIGVFFKYWQSLDIKFGPNLLQIIYQQIRRAAADADAINNSGNIIDRLFTEEGTEDKLPSVKTSEKYAYVLGQLLIYAIEAKDEEMASRLIKKRNIHLTQSHYETTRNPLVVVLDVNLSSVISRLLSKHAWQAYQPSDKHSLLYYPIKHKELATLRQLLQAGVDPNEKSLRPNTHSILLSAVLSGDPALVEELLKFQARDDSAEALMQAIRQGNDNMVQQLAGIRRNNDRLDSVYRDALSNAETLTPPHKETLVAILKRHESRLKQKTGQFEFVMLSRHLRERAAVPGKRIGPSYQAIIDALDRLHSTSGTEQLTAAFSLKGLMAKYTIAARQDHRRYNALQVLERQIDTALFITQMQSSDIEKITHFAKDNLSLAVECYQWVSRLSQTFQSDSMIFLIDQLKRSVDASARFTKIKSVYDASLHHPTSAVTQWDRQYAGAAREALNQRLVEQRNVHQVVATLGQGNKRLLLGYKDDAQYQSNLRYIRNSMGRLKTEGVTTIYLSLDKFTLFSSSEIDLFMKRLRRLPEEKLYTSLGQLCLNARDLGITLVVLPPLDQPESELQKRYVNETEVARLKSKKFIAVYPQHYLLSSKSETGFLPGIALRLGLPALEIQSVGQLQVLDDIPSRLGISADQRRGLSAHRRPAQPFNSSEWGRTTMVAPSERLARSKSKAIFVLENDPQAIDAAERLFNKDPGNRVVFDIGAEGEIRLRQGDPGILNSDSPILTVGHGREGVAERDNQTLGGSNPTELATRMEKALNYLEVQYGKKRVPAAITLVGCSLTDYAQQTGGYARQFAEALAHQGLYANIGAYRTEVEVEPSGQRLTRSEDDHWHHKIREDKLLLRWNAAKELVTVTGMTVPRSPTHPTKLTATQATQHSVITPSDALLIQQTESARQAAEVASLERTVSAEIERHTSVLNSALNSEGGHYRFKGLQSTEDGKTQLTFVSTVQEGQEKPLERQVISESDVFTRMSSVMSGLAPEIANVEGTSTMNVAFIAMHFLSNQHENSGSLWSQFVNISNLAQILHGIGQDVYTFVKTVQVLRGAGSKAQSMLSRLLGGTPITHAGSAISVGVDIINFVDAIMMVEEIPPGAQKDLAITRAALAGIQLLADTSLAVLGVAASVSPAAATAMTILGPLSIPFAGVMIGVGAWIQAITYNNTHYQIELDQVVAPFRHSISKQAITTTEVAQVDGNHPNFIYLEPYVPIKEIVIRGEKLFVQVADIGIPRFSVDRTHTTRHAESISAYPAFGFETGVRYQQSVTLKPTTLLSLSAALDGHYNFMHDTGAYGSLEGKEIFNKFAEHYARTGHFPFTIGGFNAVNTVVFHPLPTQYSIKLDEGTRYISFQETQEVKAIPGQDHYGLRDDQLPTPIANAAYASLLTYQFQGGGGTTFIDLPDDARQIAIEPSRENKKRQSERWVVDITPDKLATVVHREKVWSTLQKIREREMGYQEMISALRELRLDDDTVREEIQRLEAAGEHVTNLRVKPSASIARVEAIFVSTQRKEKAEITAAQQEHAQKLGLHKVSAGWELTLGNRKIAIAGELPGSVVLNMRLLALPGVTLTLTSLIKSTAEKQKFNLTLAVDNLNALSGDKLAVIQATVQRYFNDPTRFVVAPQIYLNIQIEQGKEARGSLELTTQRWQAISQGNHRDGEKVTTLYRGEGKHVYLRPDAEYITRDIQGAVAIIPCNGEGTSVDLPTGPGYETRNIHGSFVTLPLRVGVKYVTRDINDAVVTFLYGSDSTRINLPTGEPAYVTRDINGATVTLPYDVSLYPVPPDEAYVSYERVDLPPGEAFIAYDNEKKGFYVDGTVKAKEEQDAITQLHYRYFPDRPEKDRYQQIVVELNDHYMQPFSLFSDRLFDEIVQRDTLWQLYEVIDRSSQMIPVHFKSQRAELTWSGRSQYFEKVQWKDESSGHQFILSQKGDDKRLAVIVQDNTDTIDLSAFPAIPLSVFAHVGTEIVGASPNTTLFLHRNDLPKVTFKLTAIPPVPGETTQKWGLSLYAESRDVLQGDNAAKIAHTLGHYTLNGPVRFEVGAYVPLYVNNNESNQQAEGMFDIARQNWLVIDSHTDLTHPDLRLYTSHGKHIDIPAGSTLADDKQGLHVISSKTIMYDSNRQPLVQLRYQYSPNQQPEPAHQPLSIVLSDSQHYRTHARNKHTFFQQLQENIVDELSPLMTWLNRMTPQRVRIIDSIRQDEAILYWNGQQLLAERPEVTSQPASSDLENYSVFCRTERPYFLGGSEETISRYDTTQLVETMGSFDNRGSGSAPTVNFSALAPQHNGFLLLDA